MVKPNAAAQGSREIADPEVYWQCQRCTNCCRWPGFVAVSETEIKEIASHLGLEMRDFIERYTELLPSRRGLGLISKPNHECIFLDGNDCSIQAVKPRQCAGFPNTWKFPGWRDACEAVPVSKSSPPGHALNR